MVESLLQDIRKALRGLVRRPGPTVFVVLTLALGVGANTAIFSVVNGVLLRPLPYAEPDRLTLIWGRMGKTSVSKAPWSGLDLLDFRERAKTFQEFAAVGGFNSTLTGDFEPEPIRMGVATPNLFHLLGVVPAAGRAFREEDQGNLDPQAFFGPDSKPPPGVAILSHEIWKRRFGSDPAVIGRAVQVGGQAMQIVGVAPQGFRLYLPADAAMSSTVDVWVAMATDLRKETRDQQWLTVFGRLKEGSTWRLAQDEMNGIARQLRAENAFDADAGMEIEVVPLLRDVVGHVQPFLVALLGAGVLVLLIACANVANLLLLNEHSRKRATAVQAALGASRGRIVRSILVESVLLALLGGAAGLFLARLGIDLLFRFRPENLPRVQEIGIDGAVLLFALGSSLAAAALSGLLPALQASRADIYSSLRERGQDGPVGSARVRQGLVVGEVALCMILLVGSGLLIRTFMELRRVEPGYQPEHVLTVNVSLPFFKYQGAELATDFHLRFAREIRALPGVVAVGGVTPLPLSGGGQYWFGPFAAQEASDEEWGRNEGDYRPSLPGLFEAMGTRLLSGRALTEADNRSDAAPVVVVDDKLAKRCWPGESATGKRVKVMRPRHGKLEPYWAEVVGVVEHVRYEDVRRDGRETIYFPHSAWSWADVHYVVRANGDPMALAAPIRETLRRLDPDIPVPSPVPFPSYVDESQASASFAMAMITVFAAAALFLSAIGLYGVISFSVGRRFPEFAIRMALGAGSGRIMRLAMTQGVAILALGLALGCVGALLATRAISGLVYGISTADPLTYAVIGALVAAVALFSCWVPARRATRVDLNRTLRAE